MPVKGQIEGWFRSLQGDRLEIHLKVENVMGVAPRKIRASGPASEMNELADWFEEKTGMKVSAPWRTVKPYVIPGQTELELGEAPPSSELSSNATLEGHG